MFSLKAAISSSGGSGSGSGGGGVDGMIG